MRVLRGRSGREQRWATIIVRSVTTTSGRTYSRGSSELPSEACEVIRQHGMTFEFQFVCSPQLSMSLDKLRITICRDLAGGIEVNVP